MVDKADGKFDVVLADPPWAFSQAYFGKYSLAVQYQYPTLTLDEMKKLDIKSIANKNCWLFMWSANAEIKNAIELMEAWGFKFRTVAFYWTKRTKNGKLLKSYGRCCTQGSVEPVLVGKIGNPKRHAQNVPQEFATVARGHSRKPDELYEFISQIVETPENPVRKIELFARQQYKDWYALGNDEALNCPENPLCLYGDIREIIGVK